MIYLKIKYPSGKSEDHSLSGRTFTVGRSNKCDVVIPSESISRQHCLIEFENDSFFMTDLESANGVLLDGQKIQPSIKTPFKTYMEVSLGGIEIVVDWLEAEDKKVPVTSKTNIQEDINPVLRKVPSPEVKTPSGKSKPLPYKVSENARMIVGFLIILSSTVYMFQKDKAEVTNVSIERPSSLRPEKKMNIGLVAEAFFTDSEYLEHFKKKDCINQEICKEFDLDLVANEGLTALNRELIIFFDPNHHAEKNIFTKFKSLPNGRFLMPVYYLSRSEFFVDFLNKETVQIHIVLLKKDGSIDDVLRLHTKDFDGTSTRRILVKDLVSISDDVSADLFLTKYMIRKKSDA